MGAPILTLPDAKPASATIVERRAAETPASGLPSATVPVHDARRLLCGGTEARIVLDAAVYTLRITRQGKLILTK